MTENIADDFDLHRPFVDDIFLVRPSGQRMKREPDLIDVWFDSGAMPYAQWHYPFENEAIFNQNFPADFIAEGVDQTRGWFFTLHAISTLLFDKVAFKNVIANGLVLDKSGNKMSKRLGNAVNPFDTINQYGPDATRWYMIANANPWDNLKFDLDGVLETQRKLFGTLANTYSFFALYANLDNFDRNNTKASYESRTESDRWVLSRLHSLIKVVDQSYEEYEPTRAARAIQSFVTDDMSNWYVRLNRKRFWVGEYNADKEAAYQTLHECLSIVSQLMAPIAPFYAEHLYQDLTQNDAISSVHLLLMPEANNQLIDLDLEERMHMAQLASSLVHSLRKKEKIKVRQPLAKIMIPILKQEDKERLIQVEELIQNETNVKAIEYLTDTADVLVKKIKPNFKKLGTHFGAKMKLITPLINSMDQDAIAAFEASGTHEISLDGVETALTLEDVEISSQDIPGWLVATEDSLTVALDITITDELRNEGFARDLVNRIQNLRKDNGLEVQDKIKITFQSDSVLLTKAMDTFGDYIQRETQAVSVSYSDQNANLTSLDIDGVQVSIAIDVVKP
jgi:isoleucyl-tRNA synthetase